MHSTFITLALCLLPSFSLAYPSPEVAKRDLFSAAYVANKGDWACSSSQVKSILAGITEARDLAKVAIDALNIAGAENSVAYETWFGKSNANAATRLSIKKNHYESVLTNLVPPTGKVTFNLWKPYITPTVAADTLVYTCPPKEHTLCYGGTVAAVQSGRKDDPAAFGATMLALCPLYFKAPTQKQMEDEYRKNLSITLARSATLVHEVQHMAVATGYDNVADDVDDSIKLALDGKKKACYSSSCCASLGDREKMSNAQNYALFALDIKVFPDVGKNTCPAAPRATRRTADEVEDFELDELSNSSESVDPEIEAITSIAAREPVVAGQKTKSTCSTAARKFSDVTDFKDNNLSKLNKAALTTLLGLH